MRPVGGPCPAAEPSDGDAPGQSKEANTRWKYCTGSIAHRRDDELRTLLPGVFASIDFSRRTDLRLESSGVGAKRTEIGQVLGHYRSQRQIADRHAVGEVARHEAALIRQHG